MLRYERESGFRAKIRTGVRMPCEDTNGSQDAVLRYDGSQDSVLRYERESGCRAKIRTGVRVLC